MWSRPYDSTPCLGRSPRLQGGLNPFRVLASGETVPQPLVQGANDRAYLTVSRFDAVLIDLAPELLTAET
jgi:hypothetical protein